MNLVMRRLRWIKFSCVGVVLALLALAGLFAQEPAPPAPAAPAANPPATSKPTKKKYSHVNDFVIRGTVFNEKALSFPGVELRIRIVGEKKYRWETYTNSRGEFAVRVPQGSDYEMLVHVKGFVDQSRTVDAKTGENEVRIVFRMQPVTGGKQ
jgi:hypothetical protein